VEVQVQVQVQVQAQVQVRTQLAPPRCPSRGLRRKQTAPWQTAVRLLQWHGSGVGLACSS
jgi:hypothetical protein